MRLVMLSPGLVSYRLQLSKKMDTSLYQGLGGLLKALGAEPVTTLLMSTKMELQVQVIFREAILQVMQASSYP